MDGLSAAASVFAILQTTAEVVKYLKDVKDAPKECRQCEAEASSLLNLLNNLLYHLNQDKNDGAWYTSVRALSVEGGPLDQYKQGLEHLRSRIQAEAGSRGVQKRLVWRLKKDEVSSILSRIGRLRGLLTAALHLDHFKLSLAIKDDTESVRDTMPRLEAATLSIRRSQVQVNHEKMMEWLSPFSYSAQQRDILTRKQQGTAQWFLDSAYFKRWLDGSEKTLFCPGMPGAGKTVMAAVIVEHLYDVRNTKSGGVACVFCSYKSPVEQSTVNLVTALLRQLAEQCPEKADAVARLYRDCRERGVRPSLDEAWLVLNFIIQAIGTVYLVVDAVDECTGPNADAGQFIDRLLEMQRSMDVRLLCTSRAIPNILQKFSSYPLVEIRASQDDVRRLVTEQLPKLPNCVRRDEELKNTVREKICQATDGMFLLAQLHLDSLRDKRTKQRVLTTLSQLSKGSSKLEDTYFKAYDDAISRIDGQLPEDRSLAKRAICWISQSRRPLTTSELSCALAIKPGDRELNRDDIYDTDDILSVCAGLVIVDEESRVIRLVHYTTQEYFEKVWEQWSSEAQVEIATACLTYLSFYDFHISCSTVESLQCRLAENELFAYAATFWAEHFRPVETVEGPLNAFMAFADKDVAIQSMNQAQWRSYITRWEDMCDDKTVETALLLAARNGLFYSAIVLLQQDHYASEARQCNESGHTLLSIAAREGYDALVDLLLEDAMLEPYDEESNRQYTGRALLFAVDGGHVETARMLIEKGMADVNYPDWRGMTVLEWAVDKGDSSMVKTLLELRENNANLPTF